MKIRIYILSLFMALGTYACARTDTSSNANSTPAANPSNAAVGTAQQAPSETPTPAPEKKADESKSVAVRFPTGATEASYTDSFAEYGTVDYKFDAKAGQQLTAEITSSDGNKAILTVLRNGTLVSDDASMVQGWTGELPEKGTYVVRVGQTRNDARRGNTPVKFGLRISIID
jgi:hypothetical protein